MSQSASTEPNRSYFLATISGLAAAASMAMLWAIVAVHGTGFMLVMPLFTALAVAFALGLHGVRGGVVASTMAVLLTLLATASAVTLTVGVRMAIHFRMELLQVLEAMGADMIWAIWRARQDWLGDGLILAGLALAAWLAGRRPRP
ncbi:MAG TPA: hypothetical protein PKZ76_07690 [Xanthomonadaceae bacterium]|nr:hypothetical protein [Xanthomonadaceae bacterium]